MDRKKLIIDTDCGSDDAVAIAMVLNDPNFEVIMCTTVSGNVNCKQAAINTLTTIEHAGTYEPPVYMGAIDMLLRDMQYAAETHGEDGMGDVGLVPHRLKIGEGNGVIRMLEALKASEPGEIDIIAMGPLTNLALAIRLDKEAVKKAGRIVCMGSAGLGVGNATPLAEFNIWQDAEAAKIVVDAGIEQLVLVGWDACLGDAMLIPSEIDEIQKSGPLGKFAIDCNRQLMVLNSERFGDSYLDMADPSAVAAALYPECIETCDKYFCEVDVSNGPGYGNVIVDRCNVTGKEPNVYICSKLYANKFKHYMYKTLRVC